MAPLLHRATIITQFFYTDCSACRYVAGRCSPVMTGQWSVRVWWPTWQIWRLNGRVTPLFSHVFVICSLVTSQSDVTRHVTRPRPHRTPVLIIVIIIITPARTVRPRLHDTTCCQTCCQTGLTTGCIVYTAGCQTGCTTGLTAGCIV